MNNKQKSYKRVSAYRVCLIRDKTISFSGKPVSSSSVAAELVTNTIKAMGQTDRENLVVIMLTCKNEIAGTNIVSQGTLTRSSVAMREIFKPAIIANAAAFVLGHNHPSGSCEPSSEDIQFTKKLKKIGKLLDITLLHCSGR